MLPYPSDSSALTGLVSLSSYTLDTQAWIPARGVDTRPTLPHIGFENRSLRRVPLPSLA